MKRNLLMAGLVLLALVSCMKEDTEKGGGQSSNTVEAKLTLTDSQNWKEDAAVGVYTADDVNVKFSLVEGAGTTTGKFKGSITKETTPLAAYIPYVEDAEDMQAVPVMIPAAVPQENLDLARFQVATIESDGSFNFSDKLTTLKVSFANVEGTTYDGKPLTAITVQSPRKITGDFTANATSLITSLSETYLSNSYVELTFPSGTTLNKDLVGYASVASYLKGGDKLSVSLIVDGKSLATNLTLSESSAEGQEFELVVDAGLFEPKLELLWAYGRFDGDNRLLRPQGSVPAVDNNGNVYVMTNGFDGVLKIANDGTKAWSVDAAFNGICDFSPSIEADGSVVYVGGGKETDPFVRALNATDGSTKWTFDASKFFNGTGAAPAPNLQRRIIPAVTSKAVLIGCGGTTGTVLAIDKATGNRLSYIGSADGTGGPTGGCNVGVAISKKGYAVWSASWGAYSAKVAEMEVPTKNHATFGGYAPWYSAWRVNGVAYSVDKVSDGIAALTIDGEDCLAFYIYKSPDLYLACGSAETATANSGASTSLKFACKMAGAKQQDQGGIVVGPDNEVIYSLKHNDVVPGGVYAINPSTGQLAWKYLTGADVGGAAAVDNNGYVHVMSDDGWYHIIKPNADGTVKVVLKENMVNILKQDASYSEAPKVGSWSSPMIGNDGKIYAYIPVYGADGTSNSRYGVVMCMQYGPCTGPGNTAWPMKGADARHSGNQK